MSKIAVDIVFIIVFTAIVTVPFTIPRDLRCVKNYKGQQKEQMHSPVEKK